jgi:response regulator RpfG family c-di-GMP phosphodiesterase
LEVIQAARELRGNIPIICLSVVHDKEIPRRLQELGVTEHLLKPIRSTEFVQRVKLALLLSQGSAQQDLIADEIKRRKLELKSSNAYTRVRALWALGELGHHDSTILGLLENIAQTDSDSDVRTAASEATSKIQTRLQKELN